MRPKARDRQGIRTDLGNIPQNSAGSFGETRLEIAKAAHVSHDSVAKVKTIEAKATPEQKERVGCSDKSIVSRVIDDLLQNGDSAKLQQSPAALHLVDFEVPICE